MVNPYYPDRLSPHMPWKQVIRGSWAHRGAYVLPLPAQAEATALLLGWLTSADALGLKIPRRWVNQIAPNQLRLGRVAGAEAPSPGIYAHQTFAHADGSWLVLYAWLRLEAGLTPVRAYDTATELAMASTGTVDLTPFMAATPEEKR